MGRFRRANHTNHGKTKGSKLNSNTYGHDYAGREADIGLLATRRPVPGSAPYVFKNQRLL